MDFLSPLIFYCFRHKNFGDNHNKKNFYNFHYNIAIKIKGYQHLLITFLQDLF